MSSDEPRNWEDELRRVEELSRQLFWDRVDWGKVREIPGKLELRQRSREILELPNVRALRSELLDAYEQGTPQMRERIRSMLKHHRDALVLDISPDQVRDRASFRRMLTQLSMSGQQPDPRDTLRAIEEVCRRARQLGIEPGPELERAASLSSNEDTYGWGSMRDLFLRSA